jgi:transposase InsO family protein
MSITERVKNILNEIGNPEQIITDSGTEFTSTIFKQMCIERNILHHVVSPDKHQGNGRVERANRKI